MDMEHLAKRVKVEQVGDSAVVFHARCCDDPKSARRHTLYFQHPMTDDQIEQEIQDLLRRTEALHATHDCALTDEQIQQEINDRLRRKEALHATRDRVAAVLAKYQK
jgi:hypothetical protein